MTVTNISRSLSFLLIAFLFRAAIPSCMGETIPANSKILFVGGAATDYMNCFMGIYNADATVNSLNITAERFDSDNVLYDFHEGLDASTPKNALMLKLDEGVDRIVFLPQEYYAEEIPELTMEAARLLKSYTRDSGTEVILVMPWDRSAAAANTTPFEEHLYRISDALTVDCLPAGLGWSAVVEDHSISANECAPNAPNEAAEYTLAAMLYAHFFEQTPVASSYSHASLSAADQTAIMTHSYTVWNAAKTDTHYTGDYVSTYCAPWAVPHDLGNRTWASMGTSTEYRTLIKLREIIERAGYTDRGQHMNGYNFDWYYFPDNLMDSAAQTIVQNGNFDFAFGRRIESSYSSAMNTLHTYDPDEGGDTQFIAFSKHYQNDPYYTYSATAAESARTASAVATDPDAWGIPNFIGFGRVLKERPELELIPKNDVHLTDLGSYLQAGMIYTLVTGGQNPALIDTTWTPDERYILNVAYKTVMELGGLKYVATPPIAYNGRIETTKETPVSITLDGIDLDALPLSASIVSEPDHGTLTGSGLNYTYTPEDGFTGDDSFAFLLNNGATNSQEATVSIRVAYGIVDIIGNTTGEPGGEFADYSTLWNGGLWGDSIDDDGAVALSISRTGFNGDVSISKWRRDTYLGSGSEIAYTKEDTTLTNAAEAILKNAFIALKLDSTGFDSEVFSLESISVLQWRNGAASPTDYQLAYDDEGDGFDVDDLIGFPVNNTGSGAGSSFEVSASLSTAGATRHEVRLYYWGGNAVSSGHSHIHDVRAYYTPPVEPPTYQTISMIGNTTGDPGGEFADYSILTPGQSAIADWPDSVLNDGVVSLSVGGPENTDSKATFNTSTYLGSGTEIVFAKNAVHTSVDQAIAGKIFLSIRLDSTGFNSDEFTFDSIALSLWRNGSGAATHYQLAYDADGDGYDTGDLLGSPVEYNLYGTANPFEISSELTTAFSTNQEIRLYYWGGVWAGNTHLFEAKTTYTLPAENRFALWSEQFGGTNLIGSATEDYDHDGVNNFGEYVLNGNPTNAAETGLNEFALNGTTFTMVYASNAVDDHLIYRLLSRTNLLWGVVETNNWNSQSFGPVAGDYATVSNHYGISADQLFIGLEVEQQ